MFKIAIEIYKTYEAKFLRFLTLLVAFTKKFLRLEQESQTQIHSRAALAETNFQRAAY
jgi:hypothetical protein